MKHKLKIMDPESHGILQSMGCDVSIMNKIGSELAKNLLLPTFDPHDMRDRTEIWIETLTSLDIGWEPKTPNDYAMLGFMFQDASRKATAAIEAVEKDGQTDRVTPESSLHDLLGL